LFTKSKHQVIYIGTDTPTQKNLEGSYNIILSPEFYWVKKVSLPLKYLRDVKRLLPSLFEDILPQGEYSYSVYREGDEYVAFAYEDRAILKLLEEKGYNVQMLHEVYFIQALLGKKQTPLRINEQTSLLQKDEIWVALPTQWVQEGKPLEITQLTLREGVRLSTFTHIIDTTLLLKTTSLLTLFALVFFIQSYFIYQENGKLQEQKQQIFTEYKLKATTMQNEAMLKSYKQLHERQIAIREVSAKILSLQLPKGSYLTELEVKAQNLHASFETQNAKEILTLLQHSKLVYTFKEKAKSLEIEVSL
jgi:hypothetical protein